MVESLSGLQENIFSLSRSPRLHVCKKSENIWNFIKLIPSPLLPHVGSMAVWGPGLLLLPSSMPVPAKVQAESQLSKEQTGALGEGAENDGDSEASILRALPPAVSPHFQFYMNSLSQTSC